MCLIELGARAHPQSAVSAVCNTVQPDADGGTPHVTLEHPVNSVTSFLDCCSMALDLNSKSNIVSHDGFADRSRFALDLGMANQ
jgi:hypothetical protein